MPGAVDRRRGRKADETADRAGLGGLRPAAGGAFSWAAFLTDVNVLDRSLEPIADPLDDVVFVLIGLAGLYWIARVLGLGRGRHGAGR